MKKIILCGVIITMIVVTSKAQLYVLGGPNVANITKNTSGETNSNNNLISFHAGLLGRLNLSTMFDVEGSLLFTGRGSKTETFFTSNKEDNYIKTKFNPYYIEIPVNAVVKFPINAEEKTNIFVHAGPYVAIGVAGKAKTETKLLGFTSNSTDNIKFNSDDPTTTDQEDAGYDKLKRFDYGLNFGGGIDFGKLLLRVNYGLGLAKINSTETDNSENDQSKYRTFTVSVGIPIGKCCNRPK